MTSTTEQTRLISHAQAPLSIEETLDVISKRIRQEGEKPHVTVRSQLALLHELSEFDFGRFLLQNQGVNGYWTHYMLTHPWYPEKPLTKLEDFLLNRAPTLLATQQRFKIFLKENQTQVKPDANLACIPCGMMGELVYLDFQNTNSIKLTGIDYDQEALQLAAALAKVRNISASLNLIQRDAWHLEMENTFDLISSNGLNVYEKDNNKVEALYQQFYNALKPGGKLVTSFLTPPPGLNDQCEWEMSRVNKDDLLIQKVIFVDIMQAKFQSYRTSRQTKAQLESVGFNDIQLIPDDANIFPTVVAYKGKSQ
ncbi:MAG: SAM-dependent methyltransferase [Gammaproteobacteria bacterium]